jgi:regulator of ribonuclease activity A
MSAFATCDICDAHKADSGTACRVLPSRWREFGGVAAFSGAVSTAQCFEDNTLVRAALESPGAGRVLVIDGGGSMRTALVGGKLGVLAVEQGWAGIVVDGCVRDAAELAACAIGIRALALCPMPPAKRGAGLRDVPVRLQGVWLRPGDWLYADADGIVVLDRPWAA